MHKCDVPFLRPMNGRPFYRYDTNYIMYMYSHVFSKALRGTKLYGVDEELSPILAIFVHVYCMSKIKLQVIESLNI